MTKSPNPLAKMWDDAKTTFETSTGKKKPKDSKGLSNAFGSHTGLSGSLKKFDDAEDKCTDAKNTDQSGVKEGLKYLEVMKKLLADFKKASSSYTVILDKAIQTELKDRDKADAKSVFERALKFLKKQLTAIEDTADSRIQASGQRFNEAEKDLGVKQKMIINWGKNTTAAVSRAIAEAAKVKASPTVATYNSIFPKAARDVTMQLVFAKEMSGLPADPEPFLRKLNPYASQAGNPPSQLPNNASPEQVKAFLANFIKELKNVEKLVTLSGRV